MTHDNEAVDQASVEDRAEGDTKKTCSLQAAADILGVHRNTLAKYINSEGCPAVAAGAKGTDWKVNIPDVIAWLEQRAVAKALERLPVFLRFNVRRSSALDQDAVSGAGRRTPQQRCG